jgi:hypothetical protein
MGFEAGQWSRLKCLSALASGGEREVFPAAAAVIVLWVGIVDGSDQEWRLRCCMKLHLRITVLAAAPCCEGQDGDEALS